MNRIDNNLKHGVKTRIAIKHTCNDDKIAKERQRIVNKWFGQRVLLNTTHFNGEYGKVTTIDFESADPNAFYGFKIFIQLDSGTVVTAYQFKDLELVK